jgi:hypothetical protein
MTTVWMVLDTAPVSWADNARLVAREFTLAGQVWYELGMEAKLGNYRIYQVR